MDGNCILFARISILAGVGTCRDCRIAAPMVVRNQSTIIELEPDLMAEPAIYAMPEVSSILTNMNILHISPKRGLERYVKEMLTLHYCGTWTALAIWAAAAAARERGDLETIVQTYVQVSEATVNQSRVIVWLVLNFCVAACCGVVAFVQAFTGRKRVLVDAILAAILLDATEVVDHLGRKDGDHLHGDGELEAKGQDVCSMSVLLEDEKSTRVRLRGGGGSEGEAPNIHFRLVPDTQSGQ
ncbi:hypothetical protein FRC17_007221 [Serendipita sp. 399]|nr:hypothetical protein FRC17_007221 [Serendipita sp. 399]